MVPLRENSSFIGRVKTVTNPTAPSNTLCGTSKGQESFTLVNDTTLDLIKKEDWLLYHIVQIMLLYGLRVSELLRISHEDLINNHQILVKGLKGSENRIIVYYGLESYLERCIKYFKNPFENYDRFYLYRKFKSHNIIYKSSKSSKLSVTHSPRHVFVKNLRNKNIKDVDIMHAIGHKRITNTKNYGK